MVTLGGESQLTQQMLLVYEGSFTRNDLNTFSSIDDGDNTGMAGRATLTDKRPVIDTLTFWQSELNYEFNNQLFDPIERYRAVEFERDWNLGQTVEKVGEQQVGVSTSLARLKSYSALYRFNYFTRTNGYSAYRNQISATRNYKGFSSYTDASFVNTSDSVNRTGFLRYRAGASQQIRKITIGAADEGEWNRWKADASPGLLPNSYRFNQYELFAGTLTLLVPA